MKEETEFRPKPMVTVGGRPILWHIMKIYAHFGFNKFIIALGYKGDYIKNYFLQQEYLAHDFSLNTKTGERKLHRKTFKDDFDITFVNTGVETLTGERLLKVKKYINSDTFMVTYGDGVGNVNIPKLLDHHLSKKMIGTITGVHPKSKWGLIVSDENHVIKEFDQKPKLNQYVNGGFMVFNKKVFEYLRPREMIESTFEKLIAKKQLNVFIHNDYWSAMDTYQDVEEMNRQWKKDPKWKIWGTSSAPVARVLVTGDRGYIGSVLVPKLIEKGYEVVGLDTGFFENNLSDKDFSPQYAKINKDIRDVTLDDLKGFDSIIHLSALSNDPMGEINPKLTQEINYKSSIRLAKLAKKAGVKRFLFSSSCSIYGISESGIVDEQSKVNPLTEYARSKIKTEKELQKLADKNFFVGLMRNSTVYGFSPRFRDDLVVNNLTLTGIATGEIKIMSDGTPWRPLIDVRDLSDIFIAFLESENSDLNGKIINVGFNNSNFQVKDLAEVVSKNLPNCKITYTGEHGKDSRSYQVKFDLFNKYFPEQVQKWPMNRSVKNLISELMKNNFGRKDLISGKFTRLATLKKLLIEKKINKNLYWIKR